MNTERPNLNNESDPWAERYRNVLPDLEQKRFHLQSDEVWKKRLHSAREAVLGSQRQHPEIVALNFYGSVTKGYATSESDMDALLFLDGKSVSDDERLLLERTGTLNLSEELKQDIQQSLGDKDNPELSFTVRILDQENVNDITGKLLEGIKTKGSSGRDMDNFVPYFGHKCERLGEIFTGISVGSGLLEYRKAFLEKLSSAGEAGQALWKEIVKRIRQKERPIGRPGFEDLAVRDNKYEDLYPQTLEQAMKYFVERKPWRSEDLETTNE